MPLALLAAIMAAMAVASLWVWIDVRRQEAFSTQRLEQAAPRELLAPTIELREASFTQRVLRPLLRQVLQRIGGLSPSRNLDRLRQQLLIAGSPLGLGALDFVGLRILVAVLGAIGLSLILGLISRSVAQSLLGGIAGALLFAALPGYWLRTKMSSRRKEITLSLPDALDMLTVCVDAGLGLESAFLRIGEGWKNALATEFRRVVAEIGLGISWREAMRNMVYRTEVPELSALVAVLLQADQLGFSISDTLHAQADQLRIRRRQRAQELARAAPFKMLFPMVLFIMPATFAVVVGPAIPSILAAFSTAAP